MRQFLFLIVSLTCLNTSLVAQRTGAGYFGNRRFVSVEVSPLLHIFSTGYKTNSVKYTHDWGSIPKFGIELGHQNKNTSQWRLGLSYYQLPFTNLNAFAKEDQGGGVVNTTNTSYRVAGNNYQFYFAGRKYVKGLAPAGLYFGIKAGISFSAYEFQRIDTLSELDYNYNTLNRTVVVAAPRKAILQSPFIGFNLGRTFFLGKHNTIDFGLRTTHFFGKGKYKFADNLESQASFGSNLYRMNMQALNSTHTLEIYATFTLHY